MCLLVDIIDTYIVQTLNQLLCIYSVDKFRPLPAREILVLIAYAYSKPLNVRALLSCGVRDQLGIRLCLLSACVQAVNALAPCPTLRSVKRS